MSDSSLHLRSLVSVAHRLARPEALLPMLEGAAEEASVTLRAASVSVSSVQTARGVIRTLVNVGDLGPDEERWPVDEVYPIDEVSRLGQAIHEARTWTETLDDPDCDPYERELLVRLGKGSSLAAPIFADGVVWGEFYVTRHVGSPPFDSEAVAYAEVLSAMLGGAVATSLREAELEAVARRDPLTGLSNRRALDEHADRIFADADHASITVLSADVNGLKEINDSYGHHQGDVLIRVVADALQRGFGDLPDVCVARVGGDEFTVVVADHDVDDLVQRMNAVCERVRRADRSAGVSAGLAAAILAGGATTTPSALFAAADRAQYSAKRSRATTVFVSDELWTAPRSYPGAVRLPRWQ